MSEALIRFEPAERAELAARLRTWCDREIGLELGGFDAEFLLDFAINEIGTQCYNRGLLDAQAAIAKRVDTLTDAIAELEKAPPRR
ncbi:MULTISPECIES: DUF2164 domain-containing protein [Jeongeupia]|uniref:DUF2164 domain-containing protein n=2 Tax=Jeongeupia TaxID=885864 RepID=A0ABS2BMT4_9NEIS|nr:MULTISPECIES: DUF2164 domain-containing protein [Jeongeupia]MBM3116740.1 DUF2164 domain-containing protein [Jeongeupia naejangsanensis]GHD65825.1 hypothetical protein GCM10007350_26930 [Jeongeupia chitinilytica]